MTTWAYIYEHPAADPVTGRVVVDTGGQRTILVPVPDPATAVTVALDLVAVDGVGLLELCGGFDRATATRVAAAVDVPVGHVTFTVDAVHGTAAYADRFAAEQGGLTAGESASEADGGAR